MKDLDVLVIGRNCLDYIAVVETFPAEDKKAALDSRLVDGGGQGGTSSCCIARLGGRVALLGKIGDDAEGRFCIQRLQEFSVDTAFIEKIKGGKTPVAYLFVTRDSGKRTILYEPNRLPKIQPDASMADLAGRCNAVLLDPEVTYLGRALRKMIRADVKIIYDCERWRDGIEEMMDAADFFIPCSDFLDSKELALKADSFYGKIAELARRVRGELIVTNGEDGAYFLSGGRLCRVAAPNVAAVDTTGAGDNFHGAFAHAFSRGYDLPAAVAFSVAVASLSCREYGGRNGIPRLPEALRVAEELETTFVDPDA